MAEPCLVSPWCPGDAERRLTQSTGWGCGAGDPAWSTGGWQQTKDSEEEEGAELTPQQQELSWIR